MTVSLPVYWTFLTLNSVIKPGLITIRNGSCVCVGDVQSYQILLLDTVSSSLAAADSILDSMTAVRDVRVRQVRGAGAS